MKKFAIAAVRIPFDPINHEIILHEEFNVNIFTETKLIDELKKIENISAKVDGVERSAESILNELKQHGKCKFTMGNVAFAIKAIS